MVVYVAVGVIINKNNQVLIAKRASHQHQGDKWEFPGGKVEAGETAQQALSRELKEELGIEIKSPLHITDINHIYTDKTVCLNVYEVRDWSGEPEGREEQPLLWVEKSALSQYQFPAANDEILSILVTN
jgi:8-oxo-dGTP diphosphatase